MKNLLKPIIFVSLLCLALQLQAVEEGPCGPAGCCETPPIRTIPRPQFLQDIIGTLAEKSIVTIFKKDKFGNINQENIENFMKKISPYHLEYTIIPTLEKKQKIINNLKAHWDEWYQSQPTITNHTVREKELKILDDESKKLNELKKLFDDELQKLKNVELQKS